MIKYRTENIGFDIYEMVKVGYRMSGPKIDVAALRRQELAKLEAAREARKDMAERLIAAKKQIQAMLGKDFMLMQQDESLSKECKELLKLQKSTIKEIDSILAQVEKGNELLDLKGIELLLQNVQQETQKKMQTNLQMVRSLAENSEKYKQLSQQNKALEDAKRVKVNRLSKKVETENKQEGKQEEIQERSEEELSELAEFFRGEITAFMEMEHMTSRHKNSMLLIAQELETIVSSSHTALIKEKKMHSLFGEYQKMTALVKKDVADMEAIYEEYVRECFDSSADVLPLSSFATKEEIQTAIEAAKRCATTKMSGEYIRRQIDEVMAKHGYDMLDAKQLVREENGQILYGVDDATAINVFVSEENQVTMRVVGIGFDDEITASEDDRLFEQQCAFCSMHPQITAELAMRGVILTTKKHMPPDRKYNKKIQTKKGQETSVSRAKKELKKTQPKAMMRE